MGRFHWRRFRKAAPVQTPISSDVYHKALEIVAQNDIAKRRLFKRHDISIHNETISALLRQAAQTDDPAIWLAALILQAPRAVLAQRQMDAHPHGYHNRNERLYELIDFNDTFVATVLALPERYLPEFQDVAKRLLDDFCKKSHTPCFSNEQWEAITHGLSREIAVYLGAIQLGFTAQMTSRREDAKGVDMVIADPDRRRSVNLDVKTRSAFFIRLEELVREGRIGLHDQQVAEQQGYFTVINGHGHEAVRVVLFRADQEHLGKIEHFTFVDMNPFKEKLLKVLQNESQEDAYGREATATTYTTA